MQMLDDRKRRRPAFEAVSATHPTAETRPAPVPVRHVGIPRFRRHAPLHTVCGQKKPRQRRGKIRFSASEESVSLHTAGSECFRTAPSASGQRRNPKVSIHGSGVPTSCSFAAGPVKSLAILRYRFPLPDLSIAIAMPTLEKYLFLFIFNIIGYACTSSRAAARTEWRLGAKGERQNIVSNRRNADATRHLPRLH